MTPTTTQLWSARRRAAALCAAAVVLATATLAGAAPRTRTWQERYEAARQALVDNRDAEAAREFSLLASSAQNPEDQQLATELGELAQMKLQASSKPQPAIRKGDELSLLYASAVFYGLGTSAWMALVTKPKTLGAAALPFAAITTATVGSVALVDGYRPFRRGVPQSISAGLYLGFGEGIWAVGIEHARAARLRDGSRWSSELVATVLWSSATLGGVTGGLLGALRQPTPGRVSFTASTALWGGLIGAFSASALEPRTDWRTQTSLVTGAIGYNIGLLGGVVFAPMVAPSVARVRFVDLGGIGGGLIGAGSYGLFAGNSAKTELSLGATAIGAAAGLGLTWWATSEMPGDPPRSKPTAQASLMPLLARTRDGWLAGVAGEL